MTKDILKTSTKPNWNFLNSSPSFTTTTTTMMMMMTKKNIMEFLTSQWQEAGEREIKVVKEVISIRWLIYELSTLFHLWDLFISSSKNICFEHSRPFHHWQYFFCSCQKLLINFCVTEKKTRNGDMNLNKLKPLKCHR